MLRAAIVLATVLVANSAASDERRVALVIGNGRYATVPRLDNPVRDGERLAQALREAGFQEVQVERDLDRDTLIAVLRRFERVADTADWALVYYAGHGIEVGGTNYLVPTDARLRSDRDVDEETVSLSQVQKRLEGAAKLRLVILDACRDNPFLAGMKRTLATRSVGRGLARPDLPQSGSLVAYSAAAGQTASDGEDGQVNSPYVTALVKHLATPDVEVNLFFRRVRSEVLRATHQRQEPATYESLPDDRFVFRVPPPAGQASAPAPGAAVAAVPRKPGEAAPEGRARLADSLASTQRVLLAEQGAGGTAPRVRSGHVVWTLAADTDDAGRPPDVALVATATVPDAGLTLTMTMKRDRDAGAAAHTLAFSFSASGPEAERRTVEEIGLIQGKNEAVEKGAPVSGRPVRLRDNEFLIGLSSSPDDVKRNEDLLFGRAWFDLGIRYKNGERAVVTLATGFPGSRALNEARTRWR
ncbi:caspase family protein [Methylobacterium sp. NEAU 140]|uniref:caspase family protein n=1 Tax=Methylobacterium sp. NEAU 140 TaxID=3064945 RepID=UPI002734C486|nr:caspase family protein [Methylobacterium sp. NEAU 140]MDP4024671.1 caspase family protein [Methylobacterium sp. NEAU 140]